MDRGMWRLGYAETVRYLERRLARCHPTSTGVVMRDLRAARAGRGATVFDWLVDIVRDHGPGGDPRGNSVYLELE